MPDVHVEHIRAFVQPGKHVLLCDFQPLPSFLWMPRSISERPETHFTAFIRSSDSVSLAPEAAYVCWLPSGLVKISDSDSWALYIPYACFPEENASHTHAPESKSGEEGIGGSELKLKGLLIYLRVEERKAGTLRWLGGGSFEVTRKGLVGREWRVSQPYALVSRLLVSQGLDTSFLPLVASL